MFPGFRVSWHHRILAAKLEALQAGSIKRLILNLPPRCSKTEMGSRMFPAWCFGINPNEQIISTSYNDPLAIDINRDVQRIMTYRPTTAEREQGALAYSEIFPAAALKPMQMSTQAERRIRNARQIEVGDRGLYISAGIGGGITGKGATIGIVDDPFKNHEEAYSETYRDRVGNWFTSTFETRGEGKFAIGGDVRLLVCVTRWHEDDLVGRLLENAPDEWHVANFPAILDSEPMEGDPREQGQALWPEKYDEEMLAKIRRRIGERDWESLFQQRPTSEQGGMFKRAWWQRWTEQPKCDRYFMSWDMAFKDTKDSSFVVGQVWGVKGAKFYLLDQVRARWDFTETVRQFVALAQKWPQAMAKYIEDKANGPAVISMLRSKVAGLIPVQPKGSKVARAAAVTPLVEAGNVWIPARAPWVQEFLDEHAAFPKGKHDDQVDALSQALAKAHKSAVSSYQRLTAAL